MNDRKNKVIEKAAEILAPVFDLYRWVWGIGSSAKVPTKNDIANKFRELSASAEEYDKEHTSIETGRLIVIKYKDKYTLGLTVGTYHLPSEEE